MFEQAPDKQTVLLIKKISEIPSISDRFYLAGGTGLSLHLGHRRSEDIDMFTENRFFLEPFMDIIYSFNGQILTAEEGSIHCIIDNTKLSLLYYPYRLLRPLCEFSGVKLASLDDIACMKIVAISQRAEKKDFFDIYEIAKIHSIPEIKEWFHEKYRQKEKNCYHILKSLFYFHDAEESPDPVSLNGTTWNEVKDYLISREKELTKALLNC